MRNLRSSGQLADMHQCQLAGSHPRIDCAPLQSSPAVQQSSHNHCTPCSSAAGSGGVIICASRAGTSVRAPRIPFTSSTSPCSSAVQRSTAPRRVGRAFAVRHQELLRVLQETPAPAGAAQEHSTKCNTKCNIVPTSAKVQSPAAARAGSLAGCREACAPSCAG